MTYLSDFRNYLKTRTDAPAIFHTHAGLCSLAVVMGVRCWMDGPARNVFPNLNCVILAPSGMGKSVPLDMAANIVRKAGYGDSVLPSSFSQEALLERLQPPNNIGLFVVQEFAAFQALLGRDYNNGAEQTLTELYDVPETFERKLRNGQGFTLKFPCVTILGASSPDWFAQAFKGNSLRGGWLARFLFAPSRQAGDPIGDPGPRNEGIEAGLAGHLRELMNLHGRFDMRAVTSQYNAFAQKCRLSARESSDFGGMRSRGPVMAQKVAMLFHVSRDPTTTVLTEEDMTSAITFIERTHAAAEFYLTNEVAHNRDEESRLRILDIVRCAGGRCSRTVALKNSHLTSRQFDEAAGTLVDSGQLVRSKEGRVETWSTPEFAKFAANFREVCEVSRTAEINGSNGKNAPPRELSRTFANSRETDLPF